jgi:hypothetical protein
MWVGNSGGFYLRVDILMVGFVELGNVLVEA